MNRTKIITLALLSLALPLAACGKESTPSDTTKETEKTPETGNETGGNTSESGVHKDDRLELFLFGNLYKDAIRTVYVNFYGVSGDLEWTSSNEDIIAIGSEPIQGIMPEVNLIANDYGTAVIKAALKSDPTIYSELEVNVSDQFREMDESLYASVSSSMKMDSQEDYITYTEEYHSEISDTDRIVTIFEENEDQSNGLNDNLTDAYEIKVTDKSGKDTYHKKYVRDGRFLATEYLDFHNTVRKERLYNDDEAMYWEGAPYFNYLGKTSEVDHTKFVSFDDGHTYHFIGGYSVAEQIALNFYQQSISPDDIYFTVEDGKATTLTVVVDPTIGNTNDREDTGEKYGLKITSVLSDFATATIDHLPPYQHESYQDPITESLATMKNLRNYTAVATRKTNGSADEVYTYTYTPEGIDIVRTVGKQILAHTGVRKNDDGTYYEYEHDDATGTTTLTKEHNTIYDGTDSSGKKVNRYPTFDFAPEIFEQTETENVFRSRGQNGQFITYASYLPQTWTLLHYFEEDGTLTLDGKGHVSQVSTVMSDGETDYSVNVAFAQFGTSTIDIDFSKIERTSNPTSFEEESASLAKEMKAWNFYDALPYLYFKGGFSTSVEMERGSDGNLSNALVRSNRLEDSDAAYVTEYIADYQALLVENGYQLTSEKDAKGYALYQKGDYKVSIGNEINWNGNVLSSVVIRVFSSKLVQQ